MDDPSATPSTSRASRVESDAEAAAVAGLTPEVGVPHSRAESQRQRLVELTLLKQMGVICSAAMSPEEVLNRASQALAAAGFPDICEFRLLDEVRGVLVTHPSMDSSDPAISRPEIPLGAGICGQVALTGQARRVADVGLEPDGLPVDSRTHSALCVPMQLGTRRIGVLAVESQRRNAFTRADEELLGTVADFVGNALERLAAERARNDSEERYRAILEGLPVGVFVHDGQRMLYANPRALQIVGVPGLEDLSRLSPLDLVAPEYRELSRQRIETLLQTGATLPPLEGVLLRQDGTRVDVEVNSQRCQFAGRDGVQSLFTDMTERKRAQHSVTLFRSLIDHVDDGIEVIDAETGRILDVNECACRSHGYTREEYLSLTVPDIDPVVAERSWPEIRDLVLQTGFLSLETQHRRRDGSTFPVEVNCTHIRLDRDYFLAVVRDIRVRKEAEEAVRLNQERLRLAIAATNLGPWDWDMLTNAAVLSPEWKRQIGYEDHEISNQFEEWESRLHPEDRTRVLDAIQAHLADEQTEYSVEFRLRHKAGTYRWIYTQGVALRDAQGTPTRMLGCHVDITERKQTEAALRDSEERLRIFVENAPAGVAMLDRELRYLAYSRRWLADYGLGDQNLVGRSHYEVFPEVPDRWKAIHQRCLTGVSERCDEDRFERADGSVDYLRWVVQPWHDATGAVGGLLFLTEMISERIRAEQKLRDSEERLLSVVRYAPNVAIQWYDGAGRVILWNAASETMFGFSSAEAVGQTLDQLIHTSAEFEVFVEALATISQTGQSVGPTEYTFRRRDGSRGVCWSSLFRIPGDEHGDWYVCMDVDITARKRAEEEREQLESRIRHAQKLESLGVLAGGIAHDFNNLLTTILGYSHLARSALPAESAAGPYLEAALKGVHSAAELTRQMLAYSGRGRFVVTPVNLSKLVADTGRLLEVSISKKCTLRYDLAAPLPTCEADAGQLRQIVMNLIINASEAIGDQAGVIAVSTGVRHCERADLSQTYLDDDLPPGTYVTLQVSDTGCGMSDETQAKLFDPFFTTKFTGRGLGLAAVLGIVRGHKGAIQLDSEPERGTTFQVLLPASPEVAAPAAAPLAATAAWRGSGTILIVDDEASLRGLLCRMVSDMGFDTLTAADGRAGVEVFRAHADRIRLVLLDMTMPHMDGQQALEEMERLRSDVRAILMSGYDEYTATRRCVGKGLAGFLHKPFHSEDVLTLIRKTLAGVAHPPLSSPPLSLSDTLSDSQN